MGEANLGPLQDFDRIEDEEQDDFLEELEAIGRTAIERRRDILEELERVEAQLEPGKTRKIAGVFKRDRLKRERERLEAKLQRNASVLTALSGQVIEAQGLPQEQAQELEERGVEPEEATAIAFEGKRTPESRIKTAGAIRRAEQEAASAVSLENATKVFGSEEAALDYDRRFQEATLAELQARANQMNAAAQARGEELSEEEKAFQREMGQKRAEVFAYHTDEDITRPNIGDPGLRAIAYNGRESRDDFRQSNKNAWDRVTATLGRQEMVYLAESLGVDKPEDIPPDELDARDGLLLAEQIDTGVFAGADVIRRRYRTELLRERGITSKRDMLWNVAYGIENASVGVDQVEDALRLYAGSEFNRSEEKGGGGVIGLDPEVIEWVFGTEETPMVTNFTKADLDKQPLSDAWKERMMISDEVTGESVVISLWAAWLRDRPFQRVYSREQLNDPSVIQQHHRLMQLLEMATAPGVTLGSKRGRLR